MQVRGTISTIGCRTHRSPFVTALALMHEDNPSSDAHPAVTEFLAEAQRRAREARYRDPVRRQAS